MQQNFAPAPSGSVAPSSLPGPFASGGTEEFILPSVTAKIINPDRKGEYKNYMLRQVDSKGVQTLNGVKSLLEEPG